MLAVTSIPSPLLWLPFPTLLEPETPLSNLNTAPHLLQHNTTFIMSYDNTQRRPNTSPPPEGRQATTGSMDLNNDGLNRPTTDFVPDPPSETVQPTQVTTPAQQGMCLIASAAVAFSP